MFNLDIYVQFYESEHSWLCETWHGNTRLMSLLVTCDTKFLYKGIKIFIISSLLNYLHCSSFLNHHASLSSLYFVKILRFVSPCDTSFIESLYRDVVGENTKSEEESWFCLIGGLEFKMFFKVWFCIYNLWDSVIYLKLLGINFHKIKRLIKTIQLHWSKTKPLSWKIFEGFLFELNDL